MPGTEPEGNHELLEHPAVEERIARVADHLEAHGTLDAMLFEDAA